jgi:hypothetical protein
MVGASTESSNKRKLQKKARVRCKKQEQCSFLLDGDDRRSTTPRSCSMMVGQLQAATGTARWLKKASDTLPLSILKLLVEPYVCGMTSQIQSDTSLTKELQYVADVPVWCLCIGTEDFEIEWISL